MNNKKTFYIYYMNNNQEKKLLNLVKGDNIYNDLIPIFNEYDIENVNISEFKLKNSISKEELYLLFKKMYDLIKKRGKILIFKVNIKGDFIGY